MDAFGELFSRYGREAWGAAYAVCGSTGLADEVVQDAFERVVGKFDQAGVLGAADDGLGGLEADRIEGHDGVTVPLGGREQRRQANAGSLRRAESPVAEQAVGIDGELDASQQLAR